MSATKKDRNANVARALDSLKCQHHKPSECRDAASGDLFCGDCGQVTIPWAQQTERQHRAYRLDYGEDPRQ